MSYEVSRRSSLPGAMAWMLGLSVALHWIPFLGGFIAGFVGGRKAGTPGRALAAAILPSLVFGVLVFFLGSLLGWIPVIGWLFAWIAGWGSWVLSFVSIIPLILGAVVGGATANRQQ